MYLINNKRGFTLIEMLLATIIIALIIVMSIRFYAQQTMQARIERTSIQMQQILNAGMAFYIAKGRWPQSLKELQGDWGDFLPLDLKSPFGDEYFATGYAAGSNVPMLYVWTTLKGPPDSGRAIRLAQKIAGLLPQSYLSEDLNPTQLPNRSMPCGIPSTVCKVVASINVPGQDPSNATAVNAAGLYKHGACVPVPQCPNDPVTGVAMTPQIMVVPVSVSGLYDLTNANKNNPPVYPLTNFTGYARGPGVINTMTGAFLEDCYGVPANNCGAITNSQKYWRVCMQVTSQRGEPSVGDKTTDANDAWGKNVSLMALTRCAPAEAKQGSSFDVFTK